MPLASPVIVLILLLTALLAGCTTQLTDKGAKVGIVTAAKATGCNVMEEFTVQGSNADDALNLALNKAGALGGDSLGVESVNEIDGDAEVKGVALKCQRRGAP